MTNIRAWWQAARPFSLTASIIPPILGSVIAVNENAGLALNWPYLILTIIGCFMAHVASNIFSDYFDFRNRVDREETYGGSRVLVDKLLTQREMLVGAAVTFSVALGIGLFFMFSLPGGYRLLWLVAAGGFLSFFYTTKPFVIKYRAWGDIAVFLGFGPGMVVGAYFVQAGHYSWTPFLYSLPVALLVDAILHSNNLRDIKYDSVVGIKTAAMLLGENGAKIMYYALIAGAYLTIILLAAFGGLTWLSMATLISLPLAIRLMRTVHGRSAMSEQDFASIDAGTGKLHSVFSLLFIAALIVSRWASPL